MVNYVFSTTMKVFLLIFLSMFVYSSMSPLNKMQKKKRPDLFAFQYYEYDCGLWCPSWGCKADSTVIHGYCCGCPGWDFSIPPTQCAPDLECPVTVEEQEELCNEYNFMMECCCTGPEDFV